MKLTVLPRRFFERKSVAVAKSLLGKYLVRDIDDFKLIGKITEVEAYLGEQDKAAHVSKGRTKRTGVIYGQAGYAYIYVIHGHHALNVVCEAIDSPGSVLIRSVENVQGINSPSNGPGRLTKAMKITKKLYGVDLTQKESGLYVCEGEKVNKKDILITPRIGVRGDQDLLLRFVKKGLS